MAAKDADLSRDFSLGFVFINNDDVAKFEVSLLTTPQQSLAGATTTGDRTEELFLVQDFGAVLEVELSATPQLSLIGVERFVFLTDTGGPQGGVTFRMRATDTTLTQIVYWDSTTVDSAGADYTGPGPLTNIVVQNIIGQ